MHPQNKDRHAGKKRQKLATTIAAPPPDTRTPEEKERDYRESIVRSFKSEHDASQKRIADWLVALNAGTRDMFDLCEDDGVGEAATRVRVYGQVLALLDKGEDLRTLRTFARDQALRRARFPRRSSSTGSRTMHINETAVWADVEDSLRWYGPDGGAL